jgi:hypothetical protein
MVARCVKSVLLAVVLSIVATVPARAAVFEKTSAFAGNSDQFAAYDFNIGATGLYLATLSDSLLPPITGLELVITATGSATSLVDIIGPGSQLFNATSIGSYTAVVFGHPNARPSGIYAGTYGIRVDGPTAVPEPGVWLMMVGGIGLLGWMRLRKSQSFS